jgi:hypothetical protein
MAQDRAPLEAAIVSLEEARDAIKAFKKRARVQNTPSIKKSIKHVRAALKAARQETRELLQDWKTIVEEGQREGRTS